VDSFSIGAILKILADFGTVGLVIYLWWSDNKRVWAVLEQYKKDMDEQREMYRANVSLCKDFSSVATDLKSIVILNTQQMQRVADDIKANQFCPLVRVDEQKISKVFRLLKEGNNERTS